jgi:hypothetical protein
MSAFDKYNPIVIDNDGANSDQRHLWILTFHRARLSRSAVLSDDLALAGGTCLLE